MSEIERIYSGGFTRPLGVAPSGEWKGWLFIKLHDEEWASLADVGGKYCKSQNIRRKQNETD